MRKRKLMALTLTAALCGSTVNTSMLTTVRAEEYQQVEKPTEETGKLTAMAEGAPDTGETASERRAEDKQGNEKQETAAEEDSEVRSESKTKTETETGTEAEAEAESEAGAGSKNETEAEIGTEAETEIETETEAEIPTEAETETEAEVESETAETESESASEAEQRETAQTKPEEEHPSSANQPPSKLATASVPTETLEAAPSSLLLAAEADGFEVEDGKLTAYSGEAEEIVIPDNVSIIGEAAFKGNDIIVSVTIPASVEQIETGAFQNCENLKTVFFEEGSALTEIPEDCFSGNDALEEVSLPEGITKIGAGAFASLGRSFESITLPASV